MLRECKMNVFHIKIKQVYESHDGAESSQMIRFKEMEQTKQKPMHAPRAHHTESIKDHFDLWLHRAYRCLAITKQVCFTFALFIGGIDNITQTYGERDTHKTSCLLLH